MTAAIGLGWQLAVVWLRHVKGPGSPRTSRTQRNAAQRKREMSSQGTAQLEQIGRASLHVTRRPRGQNATPAPNRAAGNASGGPEQLGATFLPCVLTRRHKTGALWWWWPQSLGLFPPPPRYSLVRPAFRAGGSLEVRSLGVPLRRSGISSLHQIVGVDRGGGCARASVDAAWRTHASMYRLQACDRSTVVYVRAGSKLIQGVRRCRLVPSCQHHVLGTARRMYRLPFMPDDTGNMMLCSRDTTTHPEVVAKQHNTIVVERGSRAAFDDSSSRS